MNSNPNKLVITVWLLVLVVVRPRLVLALAAAFRVQRRQNKVYQEVMKQREAERQDRLVNPGKYLPRH